MTSAFAPSAIEARIEAAAASALGPRFDAVTAVSINHYQSWWSSAVVSVRFVDGDRKALFCKSSLHTRATQERWAHAARTTGWDVRRGVAYEASVYQTHLRHLSAGVPDYWGAAETGSTTWLFLEHLDDVLRLDKTSGDRMTHFGETLAGIHSALASEESRSVKVFDENLVDMWIDRAASNLAARGLDVLRPEATRRRARQVLSELAECPTVVNGDLFPNNILVGEEHITLVDWESAMWANGAIDLAASLENWSHRGIAALDAYCERRYGRSAAEVSLPLSAGSVWLSVRFIANPDFLSRPAHWVERVERLDQLLNGPQPGNGTRIL